MPQAADASAGKARVHATSFSRSERNPPLRPAVLIIERSRRTSRRLRGLFTLSAGCLQHAGGFAGIGVAIEGQGNDKFSAHRGGCESTQIDSGIGKQARQAVASAWFIGPFHFQ